MAISGSLRMGEALEAMMQAVFGEVENKQTEKVKGNNIRTQIEELTEFFTKLTEELREERIAKEKIRDTNTHIASVEGEQTIVVKNTCVITNDNYKKVINIKEEKQIKVNKTYLINSDIPSVRHTHNSKSHKMTHLIHIKHHTYGDKYHCRPNKKHSKLSRRNTMQNCGKYDVRYTHNNYSNDNYICKYENYGEYYHKRRMKKPSTAVYMGLKQTEHTQCIHDERIMECDR